MIVRLWLVCALSLASIAQGAEFTEGEKSRAWFRPALVQDHDPNCKSLLTSVRAAYLQPTRLEAVANNTVQQLNPGLYAVPKADFSSDTRNDAVENPQLGIRTSDDFLSIDGRRIYLMWGWTHGCGGACEGVFLGASLAPLDSADYERFRNRSENAAAVSSNTIELLKDSGGNYYALSSDGSVVLLSRLTVEPAWVQVCELTLTSEQMSSNADEQVSGAAMAIDELAHAVDDVRGDSGSCGSMQAHGRRRGLTRAALDEALFRPWGVYDWHLDSAYDEDVSLMRRWAATGVAQHDAVNRYLAQFDKTVSVLSAFYETKFGMRRERARSTATEILRIAISIGISANSYDPFASVDEEQLRTAILDGKPLSVIRQFDVPRALKVTESATQGHADDLLGTAVRRPDVVRYLLSRGVDPNGDNAFGKTALMHAAQQNQIEAARILLEHGANPNAKTIRPDDDCFYTLSTASVTALHYAVRYASADFVRLLVRNDAAVYARSENLDSYRPGLPENPYPIDWLKFYAAAATDRNPHIATSELEALYSLLKVPDDQGLLKIAVGLTVRAEARYRQEDLRGAYSLLRDAVSTGRASSRTFSDLSLVAQKLGYIGEALEATKSLIERPDSPEFASSGWFNRGLACLQVNENQHQYNGNYYCREGPLYPFIRAWQINPSDGARSEIEEFFASKRDGICSEKPDGSGARKYFGVVSRGEDSGQGGAKQIIYAYHSIQEAIDPRAIAWEVTGRSSRDRHVPRIRERLDMGDFSVTVLESDAYIPSDAICAPFIRWSGEAD